MIKESTKNSRIVYLDYLRVIATFAVVIIHVAAQNWDTADVNGWSWHVFNIYDSIARWAVPVFVMISGAVFLNREIKIKDIFYKYIPRLFTAYIFWICIYAAFLDGNITQVLTNTVNSCYHMWYIPMTIGIYTALPVIKKISESENVTRYFLGIFFAFAVLFPQIVQLSNDFGGEGLQKIIQTLNIYVFNAKPTVALGFTGYFILGFYLNKTDFSKAARRLIYILGAAGAVLTVLLDGFLTIKNQIPIGTYYEYFTINVFFESLAVFVLFKYNAPDIAVLNDAAEKICRHTFGIYLVHVLVIELIKKLLGVNTLSFNAAASVPVLAAIVFLISLIISWVINHVYFINRYIV